MKLFSLLVPLLLLASTAAADDVFTGVNEKLGKCFSRTYTKQHLNDHPNQTVTHMAAKLSYYVGYDDENNEKWTYPKLKVQAKRRLPNGSQDETVYGVEFACSAETGQCFIDCDGPQVDIRYSKSYPASLLVDNAKNRLVLDPLTCGDEEEKAISLFLEATKGGDDLFLLHPVDDFACL